MLNLRRMWILILVTLFIRTIVLLFYDLKFILCLAKRTVEITVPIVVEMLESIANENSTTKKICYSVLKPVTTGTLRLLHIFTNRPGKFFFYSFNGQIEVLMQ